MADGRVAVAPKPAAEIRTPILQRKCACASGTKKCGCDEQVQLLAEPGARATTPQPQRGPLIVDDEASAEAHQLRRTDFLDRLRTTVCAAADEELARVGRDTSACPYLERLFGHYATRPAAELEQALAGYAPEAATVTSARDYLPLVAERVRISARRWAETGELPSGLGPSPTPGGVLGAVLGRFGALSGVTSLFAKRAPGATGTAAADPRTISGRLSGGASLDQATRTRMETALGHDFGQVRVHADPAAGAVARGLSARAFTVGHDVAFAPGEYRPGTLVGDAILAHELAHVVQQRNATAAATTDTGRASLEEDADVAAASAVASMRGLGEKAAPRLRSGLRLQRCAAGLPAPRAMVPEAQSQAGLSEELAADQLLPGQRCSPAHLAELRALVGPASVRMRRAIRALSAPDANRELITRHFGAGGVERADSLKANVELALARMVSGDYVYFCQDRDTVPVCQEDDGGRRRLAATWAGHLPMQIGWCGNPGRERFLPAGHDWVHTMMHESFHSVPGFLTRGEVYHWEDRYPLPTERAVVNPDSYASFADQAP